MHFKTVLNVIGVDQSDNDIETSIGLCQDINAHLSILIIAPVAPAPIGKYSVVSDPWLEERKGGITRLRERVQQVTALVADRGLSSDVDSEYAEIAWTDYVVGRRARYTDLTIVGPEILTSGNLKTHVLNGCLFESGAPVLLVPASANSTLNPKCVLIAWDSRLEAARAVREALELLKGAKDVHVTLVDPAATEDRNGSEPGADIATYLARHGVKITVDRLPSSGHSVADVLRSHAVNISADMIVMGGYGHSRLRERIFGGVTKMMIDQPPIQILMAR